ncbi:MAG: preprotein translocase subunit YajC [Lysobacterales bacterium]|nr:MAG: preprotein translocase subunit YajC [Xanthomonadales bacterium]
MLSLIPPALAQSPGASPQPSLMQPLVLLVIFFLIFYFIAIRPQMKRQREHRAMVESLQRGDEVVTQGGLAGRIEEVGDSFLSLEIAQGVRVKVQKFAVAAVLPKGTLKGD